MASRPIKLKLLPHSVMKAKALVRFPASVVGADGITITQSGLTYTFSLSGSLSAFAGLTGAANRIPYFTGTSAMGLLTLDTDSAFAGNSDTALASQKATKTLINAARGFDTLGDVATAVIPTNINAIFTRGYTTQGDFGGWPLAIYSPTIPSHAGRIQSANGRWFELIDDDPNPCQFGAVIGGSVYDAAWTNVIAYTKAKGYGRVFIPPGSLHISESITVSLAVGGTIEFHGVRGKSIIVPHVVAPATSITAMSITSDASNDSAAITLRDFCIAQPTDAILGSGTAGTSCLGINLVHANAAIVEGVFIGTTGTANRFDNGINTSASVAIEFRNCKFNSVNGFGIRAVADYSAQENKFINCQFLDCGILQSGAGVAVGLSFGSGSILGVVFEECGFAACYNSIEFQDTIDMAIRSCTFETPYNQHFRSIAGLADNAGLTVTGCSINYDPFNLAPPGTETVSHLTKAVFTGNTIENVNHIFDGTCVAPIRCEPSENFVYNSTFTGTDSARTITSPNASALAVGRLGATTPAFLVDASTATSITGIKVKSAASGGGVAVLAIGETNVALTVNGAGSGTIGIGSVSTGRVTITPVTTITGALTLSAVGLVYDGKTLTGSTGTGKLVLDTSPTLVTPDIGVATATSVNKVVLTNPGSTATLTIAGGKTLTVSNTLTFTGTDSSSVAFGAGGTVVYTSSFGTGVATFLATPSSANLAAAVTDETGSGALVFGTAPTIAGGTHTALTSFGIRSSGTGAFDLTLANSENLTAGRTLTLTLNDAARTINLGGNLTLAGGLVTSGAFASTFTMTGITTVTFPTSGTLATLAGSEEFTNKTLNAAVGKGAWTALGTWTLPAVTLGGAITYGGVTLSNAVTGTGNMVLSASPTLTGTISAAALTLSGVLNYGGVALSAAVTGTGNMVLSAGPTFTGTTTIATLALTTVGAHTISGAITYGGVTLSNAVTGTGNMVLSASPTLTGTLTAAAITATGSLDISGASAGQIVFPATQNASAGANTLDDYEEGVWTPVLNSFTVVGGTTLSGRYTKIGRLVHLTFDIVAATSIASTAGTSFISGHPFNPGVASSGTHSGANGTATASGVALFTATGFFTATFGATGEHIYGSVSYSV